MEIESVGITTAGINAASLLSAAITIGICVVHVVVVYWCIAPVRRISLSTRVRVAFCAAYALLVFIFGFVYHAAFFIDATLFNIACCILFVYVITPLQLKEAVFFGTAISICYEATRALVLYIILNMFSLTISDFQMNQLMRIIAEVVGTGLTLPSLWVVRQKLQDLSDLPVRPLYLAALVQPLAIMLVVNVWQLPLIHEAESAMEPIMFLLLVAVEASVVTSTLILVYAQSAQALRMEADRLEAFIQTQHDEMFERDESREDRRRVMHDIRNQLLCLQGLSGPQAQEHLDELTDTLERSGCFPYTGNATLDIVLNEKAAQAQEAGVELALMVDFSAGGFMSSIDICALFGNALDNAIEAARQLDEAALRVVTVKATTVAGMLTVKVSNYHRGTVRWSAGRLLSAKRGWNSVGIGLRSIEHSLSRYAGSLHIEEADGKFSLVMTIPIPT